MGQGARAGQMGFPNQVAWRALLQGGGAQGVWRWIQRTWLHLIGSIRVEV